MNRTEEGENGGEEYDSGHGGQRSFFQGGDVSAEA